MRAEQILTKQEYVLSRRTWVDTLLFYSWTPFIVIFILLGIAVYNASHDGMRLFGFLELPALVLTIACRNVYAIKEANYVEDYYNVYLPSTH